MSEAEVEDGEETVDIEEQIKPFLFETEKELMSYSDAFEARVMSALPSVQIFGKSAPRLGNTSCIAVGPKMAETMVMAFDIAGIAVSD